MTTSSIELAGSARLQQADRRLEAENIAYDRSLNEVEAELRNSGRPLKIDDVVPAEIPATRNAAICGCSTTSSPRAAKIKGVAAMMVAANIETNKSINESSRSVCGCGS